MTTAVQNMISGRLKALGKGGKNGSPEAVFGMFNRHAGVSGGRFSSLNVGFHVGDSKDAVEENRKRVKTRLGLSHMLSAEQVHGVSVYCLKEKLEKDVEIGGQTGYDALFTAEKGVGLMIQHADCQAVLLYDPSKGVIGAVHAGWRGSVQRILQKAVATMIREYGASGGNIQAVIGPSLGPCCAEFVNYKRELPEEFLSFMVKENHFDFWGISTMQLLEAGLVENNIGITRVCTACSADYFSYRRACRQSGGVTGRNSSVIALM